MFNRNWAKILLRHSVEFKWPFMQTMLTFHWQTQKKSMIDANFIMHCNWFNSKNFIFNLSLKNGKWWLLEWINSKPCQMLLIWEQTLHKMWKLYAMGCSLVIKDCSDTMKSYRMQACMNAPMRRNWCITKWITAYEYVNFKVVCLGNLQVSAQKHTHTPA